MKTIFKGNNFAIVWNIIDSSTHTPFDFSGMKVEVGLYSECCKKAIKTYNISNGTIEFEVESEELQNGVYNLMCRYSTENEQAYCIYKRAFQITGKPEFASNVETIILESKASHIDATDHDDPIPDFENCQLIAQELFKENFRLPQLTADRAIADEHGNRIADTYVSREAVTKHIRNTYNQQFLENPPLITEGYITPQMLSDETRQLLEESGATINNLPDGEDLQSVHGVLKLANKQHNPNSYSGLGRQYLRKNIVAGQNILTQSMLQWPNTIYIIQYDYDLNGETITIPAGCTLQYEGGSICNGNINYTDTKIQGYESLSEVVESGTAIHIDNDNRQLEGNGMDCVILKKTPYLTQDMVSKPNTIYIIRYNYDLNGAEITIPEGCVLDFQGGSFSNGNLNVNITTKVINPKIYSITINNTPDKIYKGSNIYVDDFGADSNGIVDSTNAIRTAVFIASLLGKSVHFSAKGVYLISDCIYCYNDTKLYGNGCNIKVFDKRVADNPFNNDSIFKNYDWEAVNGGLNSNGIHHVYGTDNIIINGFKFDNPNLYNLKQIDGGYAFPRGVFGFYNCYNLEISNNEIIVNTEPNCIWLYDCRGKIKIIDNKYTRKETGNQDPNATINSEKFPNEGGFIWIYMKYKYCKNIIIENNDLSCRWDEPIHIAAYSNIYNDYSIESVQIKNNRIYSGDVMAITLGSTKSNYTIKNVVIENNNICGPIVIHSGILNCAIIGNKIDNNNMFAEKINVGSYYYSKNILFENNSDESYSMSNFILKNNDICLYKINDEDESSIYNFIQCVGKDIKINNIQISNNRFDNDIYLDIAFNLWFSINYLYCTFNSIENVKCCFNQNIQTIYISENTISSKYLFLNLDTNKNGIVCNNRILGKDDDFIIVENKISNIESSKKILFTNNVLNTSRKSLFSNNGKAIYLINNYLTKDGWNVTKVDNYYPIGDFSTEKPENTIGAIFYDENSYKINYQYHFSAWRELISIKVGTKTSGNNTERPSLDAIYNGFFYFDTTLNKPIWWTGEKWVDATGTEV